MLGAWPAAADVDDFTFDSMSADYTLTRAEDGTSRMTVVEEFVAVFPETDQNRGIRRTIPDTYNGQPVNAHLVSITDENGAPRPAESDSDDGAFEMVSRADGYLHGAQAFVFTYTLENVTWDFPDTGLEFYWDVNGVDSAQPYGRVTARLHLDPELAQTVSGRMSCYQGLQGSAQACAGITSQDQADGSVLITATAEDLAPHETLTMAVGFAAGTFTLFDNGYAASPWGWVQMAGAAGLAGGTALAVRSRRKLRDEPGRETIIAEYEPPGIDALESAVLLGATSKAIPAEVLEQAVVGSIRIIEGKRGVFGKAKLIAELVDPSRADGDGRMLLAALFPGGKPGDTYEFGRQDTRFSTAAQSILKEADAELNRRGMRREVAAGTRAIPLTLIGVSAVVVVTAGIGALAGHVNPVVPGVLTVVAPVLAIVASVVLARRPLTARGAETRDHLKGLQEFIEWAEADRIRVLQSPSGAERVRVDVNDPRQKLRLYERLLPFAVVFGQEKEWSKQLAVLYTASGMTGPVWYYGTGVFDASAFSAGISSLSTAASSSSSTAGGSAGGGSAGGGGGGGGAGGV